MWNSKTLKIQKLFQNCFKILKFQESFTIYTWVIMYMMFEKNYSLEYNKTKDCEILIFDDDLKL
jgi:hypothetical protein